jgi:Domain of unknown function (DUF4395)
METIAKIDLTSLKFNQACIIIFTSLAYLLNIYWLVAFVGLVLSLDTLIPGTGLFKLTYKNIVKPLKFLKPNVSEESKTPHQFAQGMGGIFLLVSYFLLQYSGFTLIGWGISFIVIAFAFINLSLNFCAGCFIYFQLQKIKVSSSSSSLTENKNV